MKAPIRAGTVPCAIYTRKSSEEGLEQDFNSLDAQREACVAYTLSQKALGWTACQSTYDDGGFSGGSTDRPGLQRLLADIALGKVKVVVVYKVDRLTRSLADFAKMVELFDAQGVSFVSVTQQFNTTTSMGRLTLNVLLSFAQFEREVTGERIRDKIAASKRKGMWMGGMCPIGYRPHERTLVIDEAQAPKVRLIFELYLELDCVRHLGIELLRRGVHTPQRATRRADAKGNRPFQRGHLYRILKNPIYIGQIAHKDQVYAGNHPAIIDLELWQQVQVRLEANRQGHKTRITVLSQHLLAGLVQDPQGNRFIGTHSQKASRRYRYYIQQIEEGQALRIPAQQLEELVAQRIKGYLFNEPVMLQDMPAHAELAMGLANTQALRSEWETHRPHALRQLLQRVIVTPDSLTLELNLQSIWGVQIMKTLEVNAKLQRSGLAMKLVIVGPHASTMQVDPKLIRLVARSHELAMRFISGKVKTIQEIAQAEKVTASYVTRLIQIGFLAPELMQRICEGRQPITLTAHKLLTTGALPLDWEDQRGKLGFRQEVRR